MNQGNVLIGQRTAMEQKPVAVEILDAAEALANRAQSLADMLHVKLQPVMHEGASPIGCDAVNSPYPPLFAALRGSHERIAAALYAIEDAISRTGL